MANKQLPVPFNKAIASLWEACKGERETLFCNRIPNFIDNSLTDGFLTIGVNPSHGKEESQISLFRKWGDKNKCGACVFETATEMKQFYHKDKLEYGDVEKALAVNRLYRANYSYYTKFKELAGEVGMRDQWDHLDVFPVRVTNQKQMEQIVQNESFFAYIREMLDLFAAEVKSRKPKLIVVENAYAAKVLTNTKWGGVSTIFPAISNIDINLGTPKSEALGIPVFYTCMLTGQRALDSGSYARLKWAINHALSKCVRN